MWYWVIWIIVIISLWSLVLWLHLRDKRMWREWHEKTRQEFRDAARKTDLVVTRRFCQAWMEDGMSRQQLIANGFSEEEVPT